MKKQMLAIDLGASSGRVMLGCYEHHQIKLSPIYRFENVPVKLQDTLYWDFLRLLHEIKVGLQKAKSWGEIDSFGIDTWGVDFVLLEEDGKFVDQPIHYRDERTKKCYADWDQEELNWLYKKTGNQIMEINTLFQLLVLKKQSPHLLEKAKTLLMMPDAFLYALTGCKHCEASIASTTQLFDMQNHKWEREVINHFHLPYALFPNINEIGIVGELQPSICEELGIASIKAIAVAGHDTQCAMLAVPAKEKDFVFISCGTWSLVGTELEAPMINDKTRCFNMTNEVGYGNKISLMKNITGLWLIQECKRQWEKEGKSFSFSELEALALSSDPCQNFIDPNKEVFLAPGDLPKRILKECEESHQAVPKTIGEIVRCINESLAFSYRVAFEEIKQCTGKTYDAIYMVGGGTQSAMLCQLCANICGCNVYSGPVEATVIGNIVMQLLATKEITSLDEARRIVRNSEQIIVYRPEKQEIWAKQYEKYLTYINYERMVSYDN